ncbi:MAG TPA: hypothetical protein VFZ61_07205 [Polyangiales bacterium]
MNDLASRIERDGTRVSQGVLDDMYLDPFWEARYGARGRRHADEDSAHHLRYLAEALRGGEASVMTNYARWLRTVLVTRGMCSAHLADNFTRLAQALRAWLPESQPALELLDQACAALRYSQGAGAFVEAHATEWLELLARSGEAQASGETWALTGPARMRSYLSYLADALQLGRAELFVAHLRFVSELEQQRGGNARGLSVALASLHERVRELGNVAHAETASRALGAAEAALESLARGGTA